MEFRINKICSVTLNVHLNDVEEVTEEVVAERGNVCIVRALEEKRVYDQIELTTGRMAKISRGDILAGALGERRALKGFVGSIPEKLRRGDNLHILNLGGVIGKAVSYSMDYGPPLKVELLGMVLRNGRIVNIKDNARATADRIDSDIPLVVVSGSSMNCGKTVVASKLIQELTWKGYRVCAGKVTGISALKDPLNMKDHGAVEALTFMDFGFPSTVNVENIPGIAKGMFRDFVEYNPDIIVFELGDGFFGEYGVEKFFEDDEILAHIACHISCAFDQVGAWGLKKIMGEKKIPLHLISGPVTDDVVGTEFIKERLKLEGINAIYERKKLGDMVVKMING